MLLSVGASNFLQCFGCVCSHHVFLCIVWKSSINTVPHVSTRVFLYQVGVGIVDEGRVGSCVASVRRQVDNATLTQFDRLQPIQGKQAGVACMHTGQNPEPGRFRAASTPQFPGTPGKVWSTGARCRCRTERLGLLHGEYIKDIMVFETRSSDLSRLSVGSNYRECGIYHR